MTALDGSTPPDPRDGAWAITVPGEGIRFAGLRWGPTLTTIAPDSIEAVYLADGAWEPHVDARRWRAMPDAPPLDLIAADPGAGGLIPSAALDELRSILGADHVHFLEGASHSPQRTDFSRLWPLLRSILS